MKVKTIREIDDDKGQLIPIGTISDRPDSYWWILLGNAVAVDDEAAVWQEKYEAQQQRARASVERAAQLAQEQQAAEEAERQAAFEQELKEGL